MPFRTESNQDRRDTAGELIDLAGRAHHARKAAHERGDGRAARLMGRLESYLLHTAYHLNPERIEAVPDSVNPTGRAITVRYRNRTREFHALRPQWDALDRMPA